VIVKVLYVIVLKSVHSFSFICFVYEGHGCINWAELITLCYDHLPLGKHLMFSDQYM
jgi:hypothetical protein